MAAVFWFLIIRPQRNRVRQQQELASSLQLGDEIQTIGGIKGRVIRLDGDDVVLDVEQGQLRISRRAVASRVGPEADEPDAE
jgi:preprotein translocase subunit YajC